MEPSGLIRLLGLGRVIAGGALTAAPSVAGDWIGRDARRPGTRVMIRAMGARDVALGLGALVSAGDTRARRTWLLAGAIADATDFGATLQGPHEKARPVVLGIAAAALVSSIGLALVGGSEEPPPA